MTGCFADLYWLPVGAGTSRFQQASLRAWEAFEAARTRRPRMRLVHSALKLSHDGDPYTLELTPAFLGEQPPPLATGPVGLRAAGRFRLFRYQLRCLPAATLPDEQWAVGDPVRLTGECASVRQILALGPGVPRHTWGRRPRGAGDMWTSDSVISWLLVQAGLDVSRAAPPPGTRAPGWSAGIEVAATGAGR